MTLFALRSSHHLQYPYAMLADETAPFLLESNEDRSGSEGTEEAETSLMEQNADPPPYQAEMRLMRMTSEQSKRYDRGELPSVTV